MQSTIPSRTRRTAYLSNIRPIALCWMASGMVLTLGGCISQQTYDSARQEAKQRANELAQAQAEIQNFEQQRDATHAANQRDERNLGNLIRELQNVRVSFDQIRKANQAKLTVLQQSFAALRARHETMLKEISETKRYEKKLEALTAQHEQAMATMPTGPEAHLTTVEGLQYESRMVATITPQSPRSEEFPSGASPIPTAFPHDVLASPALSPSTAITPTISTTIAAPAPAGLPSKAVPVAASTSSPTTSIPPAPQNQSWFSSMTGWLSSMFDWIWS
jgi:hypothetical protein